jgi:mannose-6-phosphate isomerase-like protein (cupin superfamily)
MMQKLGVRDAIERLAKGNADFAWLFERDAFDVGMYKPETVDAQQPHKRDEIYVIAAGSGEFVAQDERQPFVQGDLLFVPAGVEHRFINFTNDFSTWVIFLGQRPT